MLSRIENESLVACLNECYQNELSEPLKEGDNKIWIKAIAKVWKCDGSSNFCVVVNNGEGSPVVVKDYGNPATIMKYEEIYPTLFLKEGYMPDLRKQSDCVEYLAKHEYKADEVSSYLSSKDENGEAKTEERKKSDKEKVKKCIIKCAIKDYLNYLEERKYEKNFTKEFGYGKAGIEKQA